MGIWRSTTAVCVVDSMTGLVGAWVCVSVSVIRPHAYLYLFFLSFWQLNARVFVKTLTDPRTEDV